MDQSILRNRVAIRAWVDHLRESKIDPNDPETEAASWFRGLSVENRARLESDAARLGSGADDLDVVASGPIGELCRRFPGLFGGNECVSDVDLSPDSGEVSRELAKLKEADPAWFADWRRFEASLEGPDFPPE